MRFPDLGKAYALIANVNKLLKMLIHIKICLPEIVMI